MTLIREVYDILRTCVDIVWLNLELIVCCICSERVPLCKIQLPVCDIKEILQSSVVAPWCVLGCMTLLKSCVVVLITVTVKSEMVCMWLWVLLLYSVQIFFNANGTVRMKGNKRWNCSSYHSSLKVKSEILSWARSWHYGCSPLM